MRGLFGAAVPLVAAIVAFGLGAIMIVAVGANPIDGFQAMITGAFGDVNKLSATAVRAVPLLLVGVGITIAFRASVINIGGEGQIVMGALLATIVALWVPNLPKPILIPVVLIAGIIGGGIWGAIPGILKAYASVNEILSTIMLNLVAIQIMNYLLRGPLIDPAEVEAGTRQPQTERLSENAELPTLIEGTRLHLGVPVAVLAAVVGWILLWRTPLGFRLRAVGHSPDAARAAGISVNRSIVSALALSGSLSGLAGAILVFGSQGQRLVTDGTSVGFTTSAGFNGIVAALFGGLHPLWTILSSFLFGALLTGAGAMQVSTGIPQALAVALNGIIVLFVVSSDRFKQRMAALRKARAEFNEPAPHTDTPGPDVDAAAVVP